QIYSWVKSPAKSSKDAHTVAITIEKGYPTAVNGKKMGPAALLSALNEVAGNAGIGVVDLLEERANGIKSRGVYETPGGTLLHLAVKNMKHLCWDRTQQKTARFLGQEYAELVYDGLWHSDARKSIDAYFDKACETLNGTITLKLEGGTARVISRDSEFALYDEALVSFEGDEMGLHKYSLGYSKTVCFSPWRAGRRDQRMDRQPQL
ncbi:MAG: argininosuccinate synthase, partial [Bdellovibrionales bacterium]|nr:argininosuccinate synthase [Bdellovibrionales bacterium]